MTITPRAAARPLAPIAAALLAALSAAAPARAAVAPTLTVSVVTTPGGPTLHLDGGAGAEDVYVFDVDDSPPTAEIDLTTGTIVRSGAAATNRCQAPSASSVKCDLTGLAPSTSDRRPIVADLGLGDDTLVVDDGSEILPVLAHGGGGRDTIDTTMSSDDDIVFGDDGDDTLVTGDGDDAITGGPGSDTADSGDGDDVVDLAGDGSWAGFTATDPDAPAKCGPGDDVILRSAGASDPLADTSCEVDVDPLDAPLTVTGTAGVGQTLSIAQTFARTAPTTRTYSWQRCAAITGVDGDGTGCTPFAAGPTAAITAAQVGGFIRVEATTSWLGARGAVTVTAPTIRTWSTVAVPAPSTGGSANGGAGQTTVVWNTHPSPGIPIQPQTPEQALAFENSQLAGPLRQMLTAGKAQHGFFKTSHGAVRFASAGYPDRAGGTLTLVLADPAAKGKAGKKKAKATAADEIGRATTSYAAAATLKVKLARRFARTLRHGKLTHVTATATARWPDGRTVVARNDIKLQG